MPLLPRRRQVGDPPGDPVEVAQPLRLAGREPIYAYSLAALLVVVGALNLVFTKGAGAPAHPQVWQSAVGIVLAGGLAAGVRYGNRLLSSFTAIFAAFFVTLPKVPTALTPTHTVGLLAAVAFAVLVSLRQRKDQRALGPKLDATQRRELADARKRKRKGLPEPEAKPVAPLASRRYTPPKARPKASPRARSPRH